MSEKKSKAKYTVLHENHSPEVATLHDTYKKDRFKAGILFRMMHKDNKPNSKRLVIFYRNKLDWAVCLYHKKWGINKNNVMYSHEKNYVKVTYSKGKLWTRWGTGTIKSFQEKDLHYFHIEGTEKGVSGNRLVRDYIIERLPFMQNFFDEYSAHDIPFTTIRSKKLYNLNRIIRHVYNIPLSKYKALMDECKINGGDNHQFRDNLKVLKQYENVFKRHDKISFEMINNRQMLYDTIKFARTIGTQIDAGWSVKRLKLEHDKWYREINEILYRGDTTALTVHERFIKFANYAEEEGFRLLDTADALYAEGFQNKHCVATYIPQVNSGQYGIFHYKGGTLTLGGSYGTNGGVNNSQFLGVSNSAMPKETVSEVDHMISQYNKILKDIEDFNKLKGVVEKNEAKINKLPVTVIELVEDNLPF